MNKKSLVIAATFTFFVLYGLQPLLPLFAKEYDVSISVAGALMTATLIPLALAPLVYGYLLAKVSPIALLRFSLIIMSVSCMLFTLSESYQFSFAIRLLQGLCIPAAITSITTYIAAQSKEDDLQFNMSLFITGTILGGLFGRILSGVVTTFWSWPVFYYGLSVLLLISAFSLRKPEKNVTVKYAQLHINSVIQAFVTPGVIKLYAFVFCLFYSFVALLNYMPFMVQVLVGDSSEMLKGFMYCGFAMGVVTSLGAKRIVDAFGDAKKVMVLSLMLFMLGIVLLLIQNTVVLFLVLFVICGSMFCAHSVAAAEVNRRSKHNKAIVNALYVTFYYSGGVLGSWIPGLIYQYYGHSAFLYSLLLVSGIGLCILLSVPRASQVKN